MPSTLRFLAANNGYIPQATGQVVAFVRKPDKFRLNRYVQLVPATNPTGLYHVLDKDHPVRVPSVDKLAWKDADSRKAMGQDNKGRFRLESFTCERRNLSFAVGWQAVANTVGWKPIAYEAAAHASQMMTVRTKLVIDELEKTANWGSHTKTANTLNRSAGTWKGASDDPNSPRYLAIRKTINEAMRQIDLDTNGMVGWDDVCLVLSPDAALEMSEAPEIQNYIRESPVALAQLKGELSNMNASWGLPEKYAGMPICVENASIVTEYAAADGTEATTNRKYIKDANSAVIVSRPGAIDGEEGTPSYSTVQIYHHDGLMQVEAFDDSEDRLTRGHVSEQIAVVIPATPAGYLIQNILN